MKWPIGCNSRVITYYRLIALHLVILMLKVRHVHYLDFIGTGFLCNPAYEAHAHEVLAYRPRFNGDSQARIPQLDRDKLFARDRY